MSRLLEPIVVGDSLSLRNRVVMGSMTRNRCIDDFKPGPAQVQHYAERAEHGTGLIIGEGTFIDWMGSDWLHAPVMINNDHAEAWRRVVEAVHDKGGKMFFQPWHMGRIQNEQMPIMKKTSRPVLAPSAIKAAGGKYRDLPGNPGHTANITVIENPGEIIEVYRNAVTLAKAAGFDGVELLAQGGYLPHQFLSSRANQRTDSYGGSVENRCRFVLEIVETIIEVYGSPDFVCVKICPADLYNDSAVTFEEMKETYTYLIKEFVKRKVGIINISRRGTHIGEESGNNSGITTRPTDFPLPPNYDPVLDFGPLIKYPGSPSLLMANHEYTPEEAEQLVKEDKLDLIMFARPFIYNPDVVSRIKHGIAFATNDRDDTVFYGPFESPHDNYNDWPPATVKITQNDRPRAHV